MSRLSLLGLRAGIARHRLTLVAAALLLLVLGGFLGYAAATDPPTETVTHEVSSWSSAGDFAHWASVVDETRPFPLGTVLDNRSVYFTTVSPVLNGSFAYGYEASDGGSLEVTVDLRLVVRTVGEPATPNATAVEYWRYEEPLGDARATLAPGERVRAAFSRNLSVVEANLSAIEQQIGAAPGETEVLLVSSVRLDGERNGEVVDRRRTYRLPLTFEGAYVRVADDGPVTHSGNRLAARTVTHPAGPLWAVCGPALFAFGLLGLAGLGVGWRSGWFAVSERERAYLHYRRERATFDEWITEASVPGARLAAADEVIETTSLAGLVDLAIDSDRRVLEEGPGERYLVLDGDVAYTFEPPDPPMGRTDPLSAGPARSTDQGGDETAVEASESDDLALGDAVADDTIDANEPIDADGPVEDDFESR
jgi:hypothetical protein